MELFQGRPRKHVHQIFSEDITRFYAAQTSVAIEIQSWISGCQALQHIAGQVRLHQKSIKYADSGSSSF